LLQLSRQAGSTDALPSQSQLAQRYGITQQQISKDFRRLEEYGAARLFNRDRELWETDLIVRKCMNEMLEEEEWRACAKTALEREEWRAGAVDLTELYERVERLEGVGGEEVV
jgi:DNA-binding transcriptional MocR family regulator